MSRSRRAVSASPALLNSAQSVRGNIELPVGSVAILFGPVHAGTVSESFHVCDYLLLIDPPEVLGSPCVAVIEHGASRRTPIAGRGTPRSGCSMRRPNGKPSTPRRPTSLVRRGVPDTKKMRLSWLQRQGHKGVKSCI